MVAEAARRIEGFLKAQKPVAVRPLRLAIAAGMGAGLLVILQAWLVATIITATLFGKAGLEGVSSQLMLLPIVFVLRAVLSYIGETAAFSAAAVVKRDVRARLLDHVLALGPVRLGGQETGALAAAITDGTAAIEPYYARYLPAASLTAMLPAVILLFIFPNDWLSGLILLITAPLIPLFMILIGEGAEKLNQRQWSRLVRMSGHLLDVIQGLTTLKMFNASKRAGQAVSTMAEGYRRDTMSVLRVAFLSSLALEFLATVAIAMVAVLIGFRLLWGEMTFFHGFLILLLAPEFYAPLRALGAHYHARMEAIGAAEKIVALLDIPVPGDKPVSGVIAADKPPRITFEQVSVTFADGRQGLDQVSFEIASGEAIALVGPSGAGKSTILNLIAGFISPTAGRILADGVPLEDIDIGAWRGRIAMLTQRPHLFSASVLDNIAMAPGAQHDRATMLSAAAAAARQAHADAVIDRLALGYDTIIGDGGAGLSGGEVQRVALARAFHRQPGLVLLDEPTAHLDRATEAVVLNATQRLIEGRTSLTIAHRLETIRAASRILVFDKGRLVEVGTHAQLQHAGGLYARMAGRAAGAEKGDIV